MYRGIIQQATWSGPGTYLRARIDQYALDKVFGHGRIWRVTYDGMERDRTQPRMLNETPAQLVAHLSHPNGWWRDTRAAAARAEAGQVGRPRAAADRLDSRQLGQGNLLARFHALWTLEGPRRARRRDACARR